MKYMLLLLAAIGTGGLGAQSFTADHHRLLHRAQVQQEMNPGTGRSRAKTGGIRWYQNHIGPQLATQCVFSLTCSRFSDQAFREFGFLKGYFLSFDRVMRCNKITVLETFPVRLDALGKIREEPADFARTHSHP